jgi:hypothetical protein
MPESRDTKVVKRSTCPSMRTSASEGSVNGGMRAMIPPRRRWASNTPSAPPAAASTRLSVRNCANTRPRLAPRAARTATSRWRNVPRASSRFATFAQAIRSTKPTAPRSSHSPVTVSRLRKFPLRGSTPAPQPLADRGFASAIAAATDSMFALAWARDTPGFRRPMTISQCAS